MTELGARLKEARLQKGYSLDDLQEITKIQKRYLVGIEDGNYASMPGSFYVRAFIKQYAEAVGLNAHEILQEYQKEIPVSQVAEVSQSLSQNHTRRKLVKTTSSSRVMEAVPKLIVGLFAIVIVVIMISLIWTKVNETSPIVEEDDVLEYSKPVITKDPEEEAKDDEEENKDDENAEEVEEPTQTLSPAVALADGESFEYTLTNANEMKVRIDVVSGPSWIGIRDLNGTELLGANAKGYNVGETLEFDASQQDYIRIRLGRALNVKVFINDLEVPINTEKVTQNLIIKKEVAAQ